MVFALNTKFGDTPPLLKFLDPMAGFWNNAESKKIISAKEIKLAGTKDVVEIAFDDRMIPHIFANNDHDLYFAQGFVTAKHRLWQMDFQTRFASGRMSEVVGAKALEVDRYQRRMGMVFGAEQSLAGMMEDPKSKEMILAYTAGINAYIKTLSKETYPLEFKLLDYAPELWTPIKCALLLKQMSAVLAMGSDEFYMSNILNVFGPEVTADLFPDYPFREDPIVPNGTKWDFTPLPIPPTAPIFNEKLSSLRTRQKEEGIGSNNWAIGGQKTASGFPMLANDPHLDLSLPSIWYQIQLHAPGVNSYGVSLPGAPGVIVGFNETTAWGVTNVAADVLDFYKIKFQDNSYKQYWHDNTWKPTNLRLENIKVRNGKVHVDSVYYTHHGPVVYMDRPNYSRANNVPTGSALRWIAHEKSNELLTFFKLNRGKNYDDYRDALTYYTAPAQNFVFASIDNDIAITPNGKFPLKYKNQGKFVLDGTRMDNDWQGWIPPVQNPTVKNPSLNYVSSANQSSTNPSYPYYINWEFSPYERGKRINDRLKVMNNANLDSMKNLLMDSYSIFAQNIVEPISKQVDVNQLNATQKEAFNLLKQWDKVYSANTIAGSVFDLWTKILTDEIWEDEFKVKDIPMRYPSRDRTVEMIINTPDAKWFDNINTPEKETLSLLVNRSFKAACDSLERKYGPIGDKWNWGKVKNTHVPHLAKVNGLGSDVMHIGGAKGVVNSLSETNGPSWRMVIELGKEPKGHGVFPGGQSGNPGSFFYNNMTETWAKGDLFPLYYMKNKTDKQATIISRLKINKK